MRRVQIGDMVWATNCRDGGVFYRRPTEGAYHQTRGNGQTRTFEGLPQFIMYLRRQRLCVGRVQPGSAFGW